MADDASCGEMVSQIAQVGERGAVLVGVIALMRIKERTMLCTHRNHVRSHTGIEQASKCKRYLNTHCSLISCGVVNP
eukprot:6204042-Pleurochrysis_carterae.AAC.2